MGHLLHHLIQPWLNYHSETSFTTDVFGNMPGLPDAQSEISCCSGHSFMGNHWEVQRHSHRMLSDIGLHRLTLTTGKRDAGGPIFYLQCQNTAGNLLLCRRGVWLQHILHSCGSSADVCLSSAQLGPTSRANTYCHHWRLQTGLKSFLTGRTGETNMENLVKLH